MVHLAKLKVKHLGLVNVEKIIVGDIQILSDYFDSNTFDFITSRCTFCSVPDPIKGLKEVAKVLRPTGKLIQIEHGLSDFKPVNMILRLFDPTTFKKFGVHVTRNHIANLRLAGFRLIHHWNIEPTGIFKVYISKLLKKGK
jgi:ubiquinone/menaquinone biosynthesis C-methylase UbiE